MSRLTVGVNVYVTDPSLGMHVADPSLGYACSVMSVL